MDDYTPENLKLWTMPDNYMGEVWPATYVFLGQNRDSDALERSNFTSALAAIGGESDTVTVVREGHWAIGWVEWIAIHQDDAKALRKADEIAAALTEYPVVDEDNWSELEHEEACQTWEDFNISDRIEVCARFGVSIFAARRNEVPQDDTGAIFDYLRGC